MYPSHETKELIISDAVGTLSSKSSDSKKREYLLWLLFPLFPMFAGILYPNTIRMFIFI